MKEYLTALKDIKERGTVRKNRTGIDTIGIFGYQMRFDLDEGFPAVTTKKLQWKAVVSELLWFLEGSTDERRLCEIHHGRVSPELTTIWTANADKQGVELGYENNDHTKELGPVYGEQFRNFNGTDQLARLIHDLKHNPESRRHIISMWNANKIDEMALPPCHVLCQFSIHDGRLSCLMYQRSADFALGVPFNIASYALLTHMLAQITGLQVGELIHTIGDAHIYTNHLDGINEQLTRKPLLKPILLMPEFVYLDTMLTFDPDDFKLFGYEHHPAISFDMAV